MGIRVEELSPGNLVVENGKVIRVQVWNISRYSNFTPLFANAISFTFANFKKQGEGLFKLSPEHPAELRKTGEGWWVFWNEMRVKLRGFHHLQNLVIGITGEFIPLPKDFIEKCNLFIRKG